MSAPLSPIGMRHGSPVTEPGSSSSVATRSGSERTTLTFGRASGHARRTNATASSSEQPGVATWVCRRVSAPTVRPATWAGASFGLRPAVP